MASADLKDELCCSICLNIYRDPVMLNCGHNFCRKCIDRVLDTQVLSAHYSCPECRADFQVRPVLQSARALRNIAEKFLLCQPNQKVTGIVCTYCVDFPVPAKKSCLQCECSLCGKHLGVHIKSPLEHILSDPTDSPGNRKCSVHKKILEYYCTMDKVTVCVYCIAVGGHKGHQVESLHEASEKEKKKLKKDLEKLASNKAWAEKQARSLQERRKFVQDKAAGVTKRVAALFREFRRELENIEKKVLSEISMQEAKTSLSISNLIQQVEKQKAEICKRMSHIEALCKTTDPLTVLKDQNSDVEDICHTKQEEKMDTMIPYERDFHEDRITDSLHKLSDIIKDMHIRIQQPAALLLDEETASNDIQISGLKTASWSKGKIYRLQTPNRFNNNQVISRRSFSLGWHSWEVDTSCSKNWRIGLCYPSMDRKSYIGETKDSWCLRRYDQFHNTAHENKYKDTWEAFPYYDSDVDYYSSRHSLPMYSLMHQNTSVSPLHMPTSNGFRISLDYEAGRISFYELSTPVRHLHTFTTTFTEPLHVAIALWDGSMTITN